MASYFQKLNFSLNFFSWISDRQSINNKAKIRSNPSSSPVTDFQDNIPFTRLPVFSAAYLPINTAILSLINLPVKKAGIIYRGFILAIPPAINKGVEGRGINV